MQPDTKAYISVMAEIKRRAIVVNALLNDKANVVYKQTQVESMVLQIRMITELIALASLAANKEIFEEQSKKFNKHWRPDEIIKDVEKLNPNFYPIPVKDVASGVNGAPIDLVSIENGFLTKDELISVHGRCGDLLHAKNPYGKGVDYNYYGRMVPQWLTKIKVLLNCHTVRLLDDDCFYLVHIAVKGSDLVHMYTFREESDA